MNHTITLVTGNKGKLSEWQRLLPSSIVLESADVDLIEIQSLSLCEIVADKAKRAFEIVRKPVIVDDSAVGLDRLGGLPGPFIKFFNEKLGSDAIFQLAERAGESGTTHCAAAYYDGTELICVESVVNGTIVEARGEGGFGFDRCFIPEGQTKTYGQMTPEEKDLVSHRSKAVRMLLDELAKK